MSSVFSERPCLNKQVEGSQRRHPISTSGFICQHTRVKTYMHVYYIYVDTHKERGKERERSAKVVFT